MKKRNIEAIHPLSPLQSAFLFHGVDGRHADPGQLQMRVAFEGELDAGAFEAAWQWLVKRYTVLRTSIHWQGLEKPLQVVHRECSFRVRFETDADINGYAGDDRQQRFDLGQAPVQRVAIFSPGPTHHTMVWSCHHILLDGWSAALLLRQLMVRYRSLIDATEFRPEPVVPYQDWLKYISAVNNSAARTFWSDELAGVQVDAGLWAGQAGSNGFERVSLQLSPDLIQRTTRLVRVNQITLGVLMQAVWAVAIGRIKQTDEVLFGVTVSGRSAPVPGIEAMVGLFVNSLPLRVRLTQTQSMLELLGMLQETGRRRSDHEHVSLADLYRWNCFSGQQPFDNLLVVENFGWHEGEDLNAPLRIRAFKGDIATYYPLTLVVIPGKEFRLKLFYMTGLIDQTAAAELLTLIQNLLLAIVDEPEISLEKLPCLSAPNIPLRKSIAKKPKFSYRSVFRTHDDRSEENTSFENLLLQVWRETLHVGDIGIHDNFFDLGGNSFLGLALIERVNQVSGRRLPLVTIFEAPTVAEMVDRLEQGFECLPGTRLIPIRSEGDRPPFFMIYSGNQMASIINRHSDSRQPFYVIESHWNYGDISLTETIERLAAAHIDDMRSVQQEGPWFIGGYSMGAWVAFEIAQQLQAQGEQVGLLFLFDPRARQDMFASIEGFQTKKASSAGVMRTKKYHLLEGISKKLSRKREELAEYSVLGKSRYIIREVRELAGFLLKRSCSGLREAYKTKLSEPSRLAIADRFYRYGKPIPVSLRTLYVARAYQRACSHYQPRQYEGSMVIFYGNDFRAFDIWEHLGSGKAQLVKFDSGHLEFALKPELVEQWVPELLRYIGQAQNMFER